MSDRELRSLERKQDRIRTQHYGDDNNISYRPPPSLAKLARDDLSRDQFDDDDN